MATWFAQNSSVNIDSAGQWNSVAGGGGTVLTWASLGAADILVANGKTAITINVSFTCATITTTATGGTAGGGFLLAAGVTVTSHVVAGTTTCLTRSASGAESFVVGNVTGGAGSTASGVANSSSGTVTITGNVTGGSASDLAVGVNNGSTGTVTITGNVTGGSGNVSVGVNNGSTGTVTITGNVTGGSTNCTGVSNGSTGTVSITGNVTGGSGVTAYGVQCSSTGTVSITGDITAGGSNGCVGVYSVQNASCLLIGATQTANSHGTPAVLSLKPLIHASATLQHTYRVNNAGVSGVARSLYTGGVNLGQPVVANVRSGTVYGAASEYTGTLAVPSPTLVAIGVSTDNTVGSYAPTGGLDAAGVRTAIGLASANLDTQLSGIQSDTNDIQTRLPAALDGGKMTAVLDSAAILAVADQVWDEATSGHTTAGTYGGRIVRATNSNTEVQITGSHHIAADIHELQSGVITAGDFAANSLTASALATDAVTEIQSGLATSAALVTLRGADNDTLKTLSDQIDTVSADVSSIASVSREAF